MSLETGTYISDLIATNPTASDPKSEGDDHLRLLKSTIKATFPNVTGEVTATHTELNQLDGVTLSEDFVSTSGDSMSGNLDIVTSSPRLNIKSTSDGNTHVYFLDSAGDEKGLIYVETGASPTMRFRVNGTAHLDITDSGNISAGAAAPTSDSHLTTKGFTDAAYLPIDGVSGINTGDEPDATTSIKGIVELETPAETVAGVSTITATTAAGVKAYVDATVDATNRSQVFTVSGTWTKPTTGNIAIIECWGGGGSGARDDGGSSQQASGGGGGEYIKRMMLLSDLGATEVVTVAVTTPGRNSDGGGTAGGNTTFGTHLTANGGGAGKDNSPVGTTTSGGYTYNNFEGKGGNSTTSAVGEGSLHGGGGGGAGANADYVGGVSTFAGNGGDGRDGSDAAGNGGWPSGGGGASDAAESGDGAAGYCRVTVI